MFSGPTTSARTLNPLSKILASLIESGHSIRFLGLQKSRPEDGSVGDTAILKTLHTSLPARLQAKCSFFELQPDAQSISAAYDSVCLTIGMRFHSLIFSAINECPFVGLAHEPKIDALCKEYDLPSVPVDKMTYEILETAINSALLHPVSRDQIVRNQISAQESFKSWTGVPS